MTSVETAMRSTLKKELIKALVGFKRAGQTKKEKWIASTPGQLVLASSQTSETAEIAKALTEVEAGDKGALRDVRKRHAASLKRLSEMIKGNLSKLSRLKLVTLITIEIHTRDVMER